MKLTVALLLLLLVGGCASTGPVSREVVPVSVSAANYSQLSDERLYDETHAPVAIPSGAPAISRADQTHRYLLLPGEVYPNDVPMDAVYREVRLALQERGYVDAEHETKVGRAPVAIDYLLRVHFGQRLWLNPSVRSDRLTWGNDGLEASRFKTGLLSEFSRDPREGLSPDEIRHTSGLLAAIGGGFGIGTKGDWSTANAYGASNRELSAPLRQEMAASASHPYYIIVVEAFRFDDVDKRDRKAPCIWAVFIAVPVEAQQKFSDVLRAMLKTATPYFGETTHGRQVYEVPPGKVILGTPEEIP